MYKCSSINVGHALKQTLRTACAASQMAQLASPEAVTASPESKNRTQEMYLQHSSEDGKKQCEHLLNPRECKAEEEKGNQENRTS